MLEYLKFNKTGQDSIRVVPFFFFFEFAILLLKQFV